MTLQTPAQDIIRWLEYKIDYTFTDKSIAWEALQLAGNGTTIISSRDMPDGTKRLAIVGDIAIYMVLSVRWYHTGDSKGEHIVLVLPAADSELMC